MFADAPRWIHGGREPRARDVGGCSRWHGNCMPLHVDAARCIRWRGPLGRSFAKVSLDEALSDKLVSRLACA